MPDDFPIRSAPRVVPAEEAKLADTDLVMGVTIAGRSRAYPVNLMWGPQDEVLNDELGGAAIAATWCPIAHAGVVYDREVGGQRVEFGTLGLQNGVFQLYDDQTHSQWSQVSGIASRGPFVGRVLRKRDTMLTTWATWRRLHADTTVFYDPALPDNHVFNQGAIARITRAGPGPLRNEDLVGGVEGQEGSRAWLLRQLGVANVVNDRFDVMPVAVYLAGDAVTFRVMSRVVAGRVLTFSSQKQDRLRDAETGTTWDALSGRALEGPLAGRTLESLVVSTALWYAWKSEHPGTTLWGEETSDTAGR